MQWDKLVYIGEQGDNTVHWGMLFRKSLLIELKVSKGPIKQGKKQ